MKKSFIEYLEKFSDPNERLGKTCPNCGSDKIAFFQYGLGEDEELQPLIDSGDIIPMGCIVGKENLACRECEYAWASVDQRDF
ncbi:MAG: hypothetical protein IPJ75_14715 [Ignavibacteriales bacterium]|nr:hypothetical protein [Ignavibacteriales bacterium]